MAKHSEAATQPGPWPSLVAVALMAAFIFFVPVSNKRHALINGGHLESRTVWQLLTSQEGVGRTP